MSIHLPVSQGSFAWRMCRMGLPTASEFKRILTPKKLTVSKAGIASVASKLMAERAMMQPLEVDLAGFAQRGDMLEQEGVPYYQMQKDIDVSRDGFYFNPELLIGASPDGVTPDGGLEIKSLSPSKHLRMLMGNEPAEYMAQVQSCMWICERDRWDLLFYHPSLPSKIITVERDDGYIKLLNIALGEFWGAEGEMEKKLESAGVNFDPWRAHIEALRRGELPKDPQARRKRFNMWTGDGVDGAADISASSSAGIAPEAPSATQKMPI